MPRFIAILLSTLAVTGCNYHIDKQMVPQLGDRAVFSELRDVVFAPKCFRCHVGNDAAAGVSLDDRDSLVANGIVVPGEPDQSPLMAVLADDSMPPGPTKVPASHKEAIRSWILAGAPTQLDDEGEKPPIVEPPKILYPEMYAKVLGVSCVRCHKGAKPAGGIRLETYEDLVEAPEGEDPLVIAGEPEKSFLFQVVRDDIMPPKTKLTKDQKDLLRRWIADGAKKS